MLLTSLNFQTKAEDTGVIISPQIDVFAGPGDQGAQFEISAAFDSVNNRFLVVWPSVFTDGQGQEVDLYGQLINADGTLYGSPIPISTLNGPRTFAPQATFDPVNERFLVVWLDDRNLNTTNTADVYGQFVNVDGSLYGNNFAISPVVNDYSSDTPCSVRFDTTNKRFLVVWLRGAGSIYNLFGQFVNPDGSLNGSMFQITNNQQIYNVANPKMEFDPNNGRFLLTWANQNNAYIYGQLINADGTLYGSEITIGTYCPGCSYVPSLSFDPVNSRFLQVWFDDGIKGQLINADGTLYGTWFRINPLQYGQDDPSIAFDSANNKFLLVGYDITRGQFLNPDGSLYGSNFSIASTPNPRPPFVASGSGLTGSFVVYAGTPNWSLGYGYDVLGKFVKLETPTPPLEDCTNGIDDDGDGLVDCDDPDCQVDADKDGYFAEPCGNDCNDNDATVNPGATEVCHDGKDNNCNGQVDEGCCHDNDGDGYYAEPDCGTPVDCDDDDPAIHPGATEVCNDGKDNDCDGLIDCEDDDCQVDADGDGYFAEPCGNDCNDNDASVNPGATEVCDDGKDNDCDGFIDCNDPYCSEDPACQLPDLTSDPEGNFVSGVGCSSNGKHVKATLKVKNQGNWDSGRFKVKVFLSEDDNFDGGDILKRTFTVPRLKAGATRDFKIAIYDRNYMLGEYLIAYIDPDDDVEELNEDNNLAIGHIEAGKPDLVSDPEGEFLVGPASRNGGKTVRATLKVKNQGNWESGKFKVKVFLSDDANLDGGDILKKTFKVSTLNDGASMSFLMWITDSTSMEGKYLIASIDADGEVAELNEGNNLAVEQIP